MQGVGSFFDKFRNKAVVEIQKRTLITDAIFSVTKVRLDIDMLTISNGVVTVKGDQAFKNELYIKKARILEKIKEVSPNITIVDIK